MVYTKNNPLTHIKPSRLGVPQIHWLSELALFHFNIQYHSGKPTRPLMLGINVQQILNWNGGWQQQWQWRTSHAVKCHHWCYPMNLYTDLYTSYGSIRHMTVCKLCILWQFVSNRDKGSLHSLHASGTILNSCLCISYLGLLHLGPDVILSCIISECWHTVCKMANTHLLCVYVCIMCPGVVVFGTGHLNGSWSLTAQGYMLGWLGDVTFTVSSVNFQGVCVTQWIYMQICILCMGLSDIQQCVNCAFLYHFWMILCPCSLSSFCVQIFTPMESVYWFHSISLPMYLFASCLLICQVWSQWILCELFDLHLM